jgi:hypothetical protein
VTPIGFEPITCPLGGGCSIQLSHGAIHVYAIANHFCYHNGQQGFRPEIILELCHAPVCRAPLYWERSLANVETAEK